MYAPWDSVPGWLNSIDSNVEEIDIGLIGKDIGINLCHDELEDNNGDVFDVVNIVLAFQKGYWERRIEPYDPGPEVDAINSEEDFYAWVDARMACGLKARKMPLSDYGITSYSGVGEATPRYVTC